MSVTRLPDTSTAAEPCTTADVPATPGAALELLQRGWIPIPTCQRPGSGPGCAYHRGSCDQPGKRPLVRWGKYRDAPPSKKRVTRWLTRWPRAGMACITPPGYVVLDIDPRRGGEETALALGLNPGSIETPTLRTPSGGTHLILRNPGNRPLPYELGPGVELLGPGRLSQFGGTGYEWEAGYGFGEVEIADFPGVNQFPQDQGGGWDGTDGAGFWTGAIEAALAANGYDPDLDPEPTRRAMLSIEAAGVPEGRRFVTLRGLLRWLVDSGADADALAERGRAFGERCRPAYDADPLVKYAQRLAERLAERLDRRRDEGAEGAGEGQVDEPPGEGRGEFVGDGLYQASRIDSSRQITRTRGRPKKPLEYYPPPDTWALELSPADLPEGDCSDGVTSLQNRKDPTRLRFQRLSCRRALKCRSCGPKIRQREVEQAQGEFQAAPQLRQLSVEAREFERLQRRLEREGAEYRAITVGNLQGGKELVAIFTSSATEGEPISPVDAAEAYQSLVTAMPYDEQRLTTSRGWARKTKQTGAWRKLGTAYRTLDDVREAVESAGLKTREVTLLAGAVVAAFEVFIPPEWLDNGSLDNFIAGLRVEDLDDGLGPPDDIAMAAD